jgi:hypothetical protein
MGATTCATTPAAEMPTEISGLELSRVAPLRERDNATNDAAAPLSDALPPLSPASESRRQKVRALLARDGGKYAVLAHSPDTDPVIVAMAGPTWRCELTIPKAQYDPFAIVEMVDRWNAEPDPLWWRVSITETGGRTVEVTRRAAAPSPTGKPTLRATTDLDAP